MTTYRTGNPLGSADPKDLFDNSQTLDELVAGDALTTVDRLGQVRLTLAGMEAQFEAAIATVGFQDMGVYAAGITLTRANQIFSRGEDYFRPKSTTSLPYTLTGNWAQESALFMPVGDQGIRALLAQASGASLIGAQIPGGAVLTQADVNAASRVAIQLLGGKGDFNPANGGGTNNFFPLLDYSRRFNDGPVVHFPFITGETNIYDFYYQSIYGFGPGTVRISADPGVKFNLRNIGFDVEVIGEIELVSPILAGTTQPIGMGYLANGLADQPMRTKERNFVGAGDLVRNRFRKVDPIAEFSAVQYQWPGSPSAGGSEIEITGPSGAFTYTADSVNINAAQGTGYYEVAEMRLKAGQRLHFTVNIPSGSGGVLPACFARTALGYYGITWASGQAGSVEKEAGSAYVNAAIANDMEAAIRAVHATLDPSQAIVSIGLMSAYSFNIWVNGALFRSRTVKDPIQTVGIGGYMAGPVAGFKYENMWVEEFSAENSAALINLFYIGDSRQADSPDAPGRWAKRYIEGSLGARAVGYVNQAVGGQSSGNQLDILVANGVPANTTDTVIAPGTNDAQGLVDPAVTYSNIKEMVRIVKAAGSRVVLDLFPLWYERNQAGDRGQASQRYALGNPYRAIMMRIAAEENCVLVDGLTEYGQMLANFVNPALNPNLTNMDPVLRDNIHGNNTLGRLQQGWAHAKAILGQINKVLPASTPWTPLPSVWQAQSGFTRVAGQSNVYRIAESGEVEFAIELNINGPRADGTPIMSLGRLFRPRFLMEWAAFTNNHERGSVTMGDDYLLRMYGFGSTTGTILRVRSGLYSTTY